MKNTITIIILHVLLCCTCQAQEKVVENRPYTDLRKFHFGILVGTHMQDIEFNNVGLHTYTDENGNKQEALITCDQNQWEPGFNIGVLGEIRLHTHFQLRIAPTLYFGTRHYNFRNLTADQNNKELSTKQQDMKTAYISTAIELIAAAPRFNNHRPYLMFGINPMINLSGNDDDILKLKSSDVFIEAGLGCDFYLPYFKLRPELKFMFGLTNCLDKNHANKVKDGALLPYTTSVDQAKSKIIALTFYFE